MDALGARIRSDTWSAGTRRLCFCGLALLLGLASGCGSEDQSRSIRLPSQKPAAVASEVGIGDLYAVVVGVARYSNPKIPQLKFSDKDARDVADFLKTQKQLFREIHLILLLNEQATQKEVKKQLFYELRNAGKNDTVVLFLAGHGADDPNMPGEFFFLTHDADPDFLEATAVNMGRSWFMQRLDSKRVLVVADTCHAGGFSKDGSRNGEASLKKLMNQFKESEGRVFLTSSRPDEISKEEAGLQNGVFTHYLLEGLRGKASRSSDGLVTLQDAYQYVYDKTKDATNGLQHPQLEGKVVGRFPMALVRIASFQPSGPTIIQPPATSTPATEKANELTKLRASAEQGHPKAQFELGLKYEYGLGMARDKELAFLWYSRAKEKGNRDAEQALVRLQSAPSSSEPQEVEVPKPEKVSKSYKQVLAEIEETILPAVVKVSSYKTDSADKSKTNEEDLAFFKNHPFREFFGDDFYKRSRKDGAGRQEATNSGLIVSKDGLILTSTVAKDADEVRVTLRDQRSFIAKVVGNDADESSLTAIRIKADGLPAATLSDSADRSVGESVFVATFRGETIVGKVKARGLNSPPLFGDENYIWVNKMIMPGDGGTPLLNRSGEVVGINVGIAKPTGGKEGSTVAISSNYATMILHELVAHGKVRRAVLGVNMQDLNEGLAKSFGRSDTKGALISQVIPISPAEKAGIKAGDIILTFDGRAVSGAAQFRNMIGMEKPGSIVKLTVFRDKKTFDVRVRLGERTPLPVASAHPKAANETPKQSLGIEVEKLTAAAAKPMGLKEGEGVRVREVEPAGLGAKLGLWPNDVILEVDGKSVSDTWPLSTAVQSANKKGLIRLKVQRGKAKLFLAGTPR